jgi:tetratricopeptide (TPR) repeat protein
MDTEEIAYKKLADGCMAEQASDFRRAIREYRTGLNCPTEDFDTAYFLRNNLGYSLVQVGEYAEAEIFCRQAIEIDPHQYNAHKNLGLALQGQGRFFDAALSLERAAIISDKFDRRSFAHYIELCEEHPEVLDFMRSRSGNERATSDHER